MANITFTYYDRDGGEEEITIPAKLEICPRCGGEGGVDCWDGGMTAEQMDEQGPDFREDYLSGMYDKPCPECNGERVVRVPDRGLATAANLARYDEMLGSQAAYEAEVAAERRMGA